MPALSDGLTVFSVPTADGDKDLKLDIVEAMQAFNAIVRQCEEEKLANFEYVDRFAEWVKAGTGLVLRKQQARELIQLIDKEFTPGKAEAGATPS